MQSFKLKSWLSKSKVRFVIVIILAFLVGYIVRGPGDEDSGYNHTSDLRQQTLEQWWTCSMHPQIRQPKPGKCPICLMDLVPISGAGDDIGERQISFSKEAIKLMEIQTTRVERKFVETEIRMVGKIDHDETKVKHITAWVPGRIDRLYVDFTGTRVNKGDHMVYLYSPELLSSQTELLQAVKASRNLKLDGSDLIKRSTLATLEAARGKLRLLGLQKKQIEEIEKTGRPTDHITIYAPMGGIVIEKYVSEGSYVDTGTKIYTITDLSQIWVKLDTYESDMMWIRYGQQVEFTVEAYPGEVFKGRINFIDPVLNPKTRTVKLRVNVANPDERLKPGMFVRAVVRSMVAEGGMVMDADMAGKWICPMHPAVVKADTGQCDICEMDLVTTESLGYVKVDLPSEPPLVIPASAPLITGKRAVVYVRLPNTDKPTFEGRQVTLGPRATDYYLVKDGLVEGEIVVTRGNFKIDSALQIQAKPSMMSAETATEHQYGQGEHKHKVIEVPDKFRRQLWDVVQRYFSLHDTLAGDDKNSAVRAASETLEALSAVDMSLVSGEAHDVWMDNSAEVRDALDKIKADGGIEAARKAFGKLSNELIVVVEQFGLSRTHTLYRFNCPMALDNKGADWLQMDKDTRNPYFGASILKCGEVIEVIDSKTE